MKICPACGAEYGDDAMFCARDRSPLPAPGPGLVGQVLAERYAVERKLGEGGMGEVFLARHVSMNRPCAIKVMAAALARDPEAVARFTREATNASRIAHPNVCAIYDFGTTSDGLVFLAMEYVDGRPLSALLSGGPLPLPEALEIAKQAAAGLEAAHELGIVHRDLKPDNIMVATARDRPLVKLVDFGIAKAASTEPSQQVTRTGLVVGTPEYMSPEQLAGDPVDGRSDQYALALVVFRMLTGRPAFPAASAQDLMLRRLTEAPARLSAVAPAAGFAAALDGVVDRALARRPDHRFATVTAFVAALEEAAAGAAPTAPLPRLPRTERVAAPTRRRAVRGGVAAIAALGIAGAAWIALQPGAPAAGAGGVHPALDTAGAGVRSGAEPPPAAPVPAAARSTDSLAVPGGTAGAPDSSPSSASDARVARVADPIAPPARVEPADAGTEPAPRPEDFDEPASVRARRARTVALRLLGRPDVPDSVKANLAWYLGTHSLMLERRAEAARFFRRSCALVPAPRCARMLPQLDPGP